MRTAALNPAARRRLLEAARTLMLSRGYAATSVDDVCRAAKLTKGSFFHYFKSKEELAGVLLHDFCTQAAERFAGILGGETDPLKRVYLYVDGVAKLSREPALRDGCLLGCFCQELCDTSPRMKKACCDGVGSWEDWLASELAAAKKKYAPRAKFDPRGLASHFISVLEGALLVRKARGGQKVVDESLGHFKQYLGTLYGR